MQEGTADEMHKHITKMTEEARQQRLECTSGSHKNFCEKLRVSAEGRAKML